MRGDTEEQADDWTFGDCRAGCGVGELRGAGARGPQRPFVRPVADRDRAGAIAPNRADFAAAVADGASACADDNADSAATDGSASAAATSRAAARTTAADAGAGKRRATSDRAAVSWAIADCAGKTPRG